MFAAQVTSLTRAPASFKVKLANHSLVASIIDTDMAAGSLSDLMVLLGTLNTLGLVIRLLLSTQPFLLFPVGLLLQLILFSTFVALHLFHHFCIPRKQNKLVRAMISNSIPVNVALGITGGLLMDEEHDVDWSTPSTYVGLSVILLGLAILGLTDMQLLSDGEGSLSPAPSLKTKKLVVSGLYAYTRNPMISAVCLFLVGLAITFSSLQVLTFTFGFFCIKTAWFVLSEEPDMKLRFGASYELYMKKVPRWLPRLTPYREMDSD